MSTQILTPSSQASLMSGAEAKVHSESSQDRSVILRRYCWKGTQVPSMRQSILPLLGD